MVILLFGKQYICVASNKGGVGKTVVSIGLAEALSKKRGVLLLDLDVHGPDVLARLGLSPSLVDWSQSKVRPIYYKPNIWAFSADCLADDQASGYLARDDEKRAYIRSTMSQLDMHGIKYVVCDMPAGTDSVLSFWLRDRAPDNIVIVTNPERTSVLDTEKLVNLLVHYNLIDKITGVVENMAYVMGPDGLRGRRFNNANVRLEVCEQYGIKYLGEIPEVVSWDGSMPDANRIYELPIFAAIAEVL